jgi:photosystem II stability/assembly factor-like uncharacterized protein
MRPVRIAVAVVLTAAAATTGSLVARSTGHQSAPPDRGGVAAPAPPTTLQGNPAPPTDPEQQHPSPTPPPGPTPRLSLGHVGPLEAVQAIGGTATAFGVGKGAILTTRDGGRTWIRVWRGTQDLHDVDFVSASTGWAVGDGILLGTVDGGQHWRQLGQPKVRPLRSVHFSSPSEGWGVAGPDLPGERRVPATTLVHTRDGGRTWSALAAPRPPQSVCFTSSSDGWLASGLEVWRSTDAGRSWGSRPSFVPRLANYTYAPSAELQCAAPGAAWVRFDSGEGAAGSSPYALYATADGGAHWRGVLARYGEPGVAGGPGSYPGPFSVIDPKRAFLLSPTPAADSTGAVLIGQGGSRLQFLPGIPRIRLATDSKPMSVSFASATRGWVVGGVGTYSGRGVILATVDGGRTWQSQLPT